MAWSMALEVDMVQIDTQLYNLGHDAISGAVAASILFPIVLKFNGELCKKITDLTIAFRVHVGIANVDKKDK